MELSRNVAFIGPQQLQSAFHVILRSALGPSHITSAVTIDALRKALGNIVPDIVLAFVASSADEIGLAASGETNCLAQAMLAKCTMFSFRREHDDDRIRTSIRCGCSFVGRCVCR